MVIRFAFALLIAILSFPYCFFQSSRFVKLNSVFVRLRQSTQEMLDLYFFIFDVPDIPQQFQELVCIFFHSLLSQSHIMELFDIIIIVPIREVLLLEVLLELLPYNLLFIDIPYPPEVLPPYGCSSSQIEYGYPSLHISRVVLDFLIFSHLNKPRFRFLTILYLTIKGRRHCLPEFIM